jgi:hypothetical protein
MRCRHNSASTKDAYYSPYSPYKHAIQNTYKAAQRQPSGSTIPRTTSRCTETKKKTLARTIEEVEENPTKSNTKTCECGDRRRILLLSATDPGVNVGVAVPSPSLAPLASDPACSVCM